MKNFLLAAAVLLLAAIASCKKENGVAPSTDLPDNTWKYGGTSLNTAYTDIVTRNGYLIIFHAVAAAGLNQTLSFQFRLRPKDGSIYKPSNDTASADAVKIGMEAGTYKYHSLGNDNTSIHASLVAGKLKLTGNNIRMLADTIPSLADTLSVSFNLTEF